MANEVEVEVVLKAKQAEKAVKSLGKSLEKFTKQFGGQFDTAERKYSKFGDTVEKSNKKVQSSIKKSDIAMGAFIGTIGGSLALRAFSVLKQAPLQAFESFRKFETGLVSISKTTGASKEEMVEISKEIKKLSQVVPVSTSELLALATSAGQLGIRGAKNITNFTATIAKLGKVSNIEGESASLALARILNITGTSVDKVDELASSIVSLGNNFAVTESEIVEMTSEVARATGQFGVGAEKATALGATLKAVGVRAEEAGGVLSKSFVAISTAINKGGEKLKQLSKLTGIAGKDLRQAFADDSLGVFRKLLDGVSKSGTRASIELEKMGLSGIRINKVIPVLAQNTDQLNKALAMSTKEFSNAKALNKEFAESLKTSETEVQFFRNELDLLLQDMGEGIAPAVGFFAKKMGNVFKMLRDDIGSTDEQMAKLRKNIEFLQRGGATAESNTLLKAQIEELNALEASALKAVKAKNMLSDESRKFSGGVGLATDIEPEPTGGASAGELTKADQARIDSRKRMQAELSMIESETELAEQERNLRIKEAQGLAVEEDFVKIAEIEQEKLNIKATAEFEKNQLIKDSKQKELADQKTAQKLELDSEKLQTKQIIDEKKRRAMQEQAVQQAKLSTSRNFLSAGIALAKEGSSAQKALMIADATIATYASATKALASPPGPPWSIALSSSIIAMGLANVAKIAGVGFANGGVVGGFHGSSAGPDNTIAQVRTGEMILNSSQQKNLFDQINSGGLRGEDSSAERLSQAIESITSQPIVVQVDNKEIARAVRDAQRDGFKVSA